MKIRRHEAIEQHFQNGVGFVLLQGHQARRAKNDAAALISGGSRGMLYNLVPHSLKLPFCVPPSSAHQPHGYVVAGQRLFGWNNVSIRTLPVKYAVALS